jgi:hypothetical protein
VRPRLLYTVRAALRACSHAARRARRLRQMISVNVTGLTQKLGQLEAANRDLQSKYGANLQRSGQPCNFRAIV